MRGLRTILVAAGMLSAASVVAAGGLAEVGSIYIAELGTSPQAPVLREALAKELEAVGFAVVDRPGDADAVLSGTVNMRGSRKRPKLVFTEAVLTGTDGEALWSAKLPPKRQLKRIARGIASEQRHDRWRARNAGQ